VSSGTLFIERFEEVGNPRVEITLAPDDKELSSLSVRFELEDWDLIAARTIQPGETRLQADVEIT